MRASSCNYLCLVLLYAAYLLCGCQTTGLGENNGDGNKDGVSFDIIPVDVFKDEVIDTANKTIELSSSPCLVLNILSDSHENLEDTESVYLVNQTYTNIKRVDSLVHADAVVHLGDILAAADTVNYSEWSGVNKHLSSNISRLRTLNPDCYVVLGNHDGIDGEYVDEMKVYATVFGYNEGKVVREGRSPWYFKDYPAVKTRIVFLAVPSRDGIEDGPPLYGFQSRQMQWIANTALNVENGWRVLFMGHISPCHPNGNFAAESREVFGPLTDAFINHKSYSNQEWGISVDYSSKEDVTILAYICGHAHADAVITDNSVFTDYCFSFPIIVIGACNRIVYGNDSEGYACNVRVPGTVTDDLWDTMVYRPDLKKMFFVRFGSGDDRVVDVE